jgi:tetrahydromethanopterin S-methyltransferase subunit G
MSSEDHSIPEAGADQPPGLRARIATQAEDAIGKLADDLLENPVINSALSHALGAGEKVAQAQQSAMGRLNVALASDIEKLARRLRSVSQRLEELENGVDRVSDQVESVSAAARGPAEEVSTRLERIEERLDRLNAEVAALRAAGPVDTASQAPVVGPTG